MSATHALIHAYAAFWRANTFVALFVHGMLLLLILAMKFNGRSAKHIHDFHHRRSAPCFLDGVHVGYYCTHPGCSAISPTEGLYGQD